MLITQTPLRISFAGGGTDFQGYYRKDPRSPGCVVSTAIDKFVYVIVKERFDDKIYINYSQKEIVDNVDHIQHDLVREAMQKTEVYKGVEITTLADVPSEGSGLGSSSSLTVGLLNALYAYQGEQRTAEDLAREACQIEIDILKKPIGKQDQYIAAYGNLRIFKFMAGESVELEKLDVSEFQKRHISGNLLLYFTDKARKSETILEEQKANIDQRMTILREISELAYKTKKSIVEGDIDNIGSILHRGWNLKKEMAGAISDEDIDRMYEAAISLTDNTPYILALANDEGYESIFEQQMINMAARGDVALGISGSGKSENVLRAIRYANENDMTTTGLTGFDGGKLKPMVKCCLHVPSNDIGIVESLHLVACHYIIDRPREMIRG